MSVIADKSNAFADRVVKMCRYIGAKHHEYRMTDQVYRSGTSIAANNAEGDCALTRNELLCKRSIALKECNETVCWLERMHHGGYLTDAQWQSMNGDAVELRKMLTSAVKTLQGRN